MKAFILNALKKLGITKETAKRAGRTFLQTALGYVVVNIALVDFAAGEDVIKSALYGLITSAIAAGFAAVMNIDREGNEESEVGGNG